MGIEPRRAANIMRVLFAEISRILNHLLNMTAFALDVGAMTPMLWGFEQREKLMEFYEGVSARACMRPTSVRRRPSGYAGGHVEDILAWAISFPTFVDDMRDVANGNRIFQAAHRRHWRRQLRRSDGLGLLRARCCVRLASLGISARPSLTTSMTRMEFDVPIGKNGDCYDRYVCRVEEMAESLKIIRQCIGQMPEAR